MFAYVGSFTTEKRKARGNGLNVYRIDPASGAWAHVQHVGGLINPSYLALSPDQRCLYVVHGDEDYATAFALDPATGRASLINRASTGGRNGVRQHLDKSGRLMVVANYASGTVAVMAIGADGALADQHQLVALEGERGPHRVQQTGPLPHDIVLDPTGSFVLVPDKGLDRVFGFRLDAEAGTIAATAQGSVAARPGAGPRHAAFHPSLPVAWVLNELDSTMTTYHWDATTGALAPRQVITTLPTDFTGTSTTAEIAVSRDGRFVYCSNRGHDSVTIFRAEPETGLLAHAGWEPTQGAHPRFIALDPAGRHLYAANEQGDTVVAFGIDAGTGGLTPTGQVVAVASPVTIVFAGA